MYFKDKRQEIIYNYFMFRATKDYFYKNKVLDLYKQMSEQDKEYLLSTLGEEFEWEFNQKHGKSAKK